MNFATLWDSKRKEPVGMLTVTDLIDVLLHYHKNSNLVKELIDVAQIRKWMGR